jgi:Zn-dependent protease
MSPKQPAAAGMKWSWKLGTFAGIGVYVHATFSILIGWVVLSEWLRSRDAAATIGSVVFVLSLFACVVLHEFGHALTARRYGIRTQDITLLPIGGLARLEKMPDRPIEEFWVALAGPAVNVVIAGLLFAFLSLSGGLGAMTAESIVEAPFLVRLMLVNVMLVLFNLLPAFPMDGGRVLRALLAMRMQYARATQIAASIGQGMALLFGFLGFFANPFLLFIALFVWIGAEQEAAMAQLKYALGGIPVERAMVTEFRTLDPSDSLEHAVEAILAGSQQDFPVVRNGAVEGVLTRADLLKALAKHEPARVGDVMDREFQSAEPGDLLEEAFARLQTCQCRTMPVLFHGRLIGILTAENIGEFLMIQAAVQGGRAPVAARAL